jgi:nucleoside-diphosphate-sugar epimerase
VVEHDSPILVTGGSGFLAGQVMLRLLTDGHRVRAGGNRPGAAGSSGCRRPPGRDVHVARRVGYGPKPSGEPYDETDWTDPSTPQSPYVKSKTLAERDAWEFAAANDVELTVINPVEIFGPVLGSDLAASIQIVKGLLDGRPPVLAKASSAVVDVRDVAELHVRALTDPRAAGHRFLAASGQLSRCRRSCARGSGQRDDASRPGSYPTGLSGPPLGWCPRFANSRACSATP